MTNVRRLTMDTNKRNTAKTLEEVFKEVQEIVKSGKFNLILNYKNNNG
jgi:hypothetical protein